MSLFDFLNLIFYHDWSAWASDDGRVWFREQDARKELERIAETSDEHARLWSLALGAFDYTSDRTGEEEGHTKLAAFLSTQNLGYPSWCWGPHLE